MSRQNYIDPQMSRLFSLLYKYSVQFKNYLLSLSLFPYVYEWYTEIKVPTRVKTKKMRIFKQNVKDTRQNTSFVHT